MRITFVHKRSLAPYRPPSHEIRRYAAAGFLAGLPPFVPFTRAAAAFFGEATLPARRAAARAGNGQEHLLAPPFVRVVASMA